MTLIGPLLLVTFAFVTGLVLQYLSSRLPADADSVVEAVNRLLPQTQCAQCGYPGCRPYAKAVVDGEAVDLCPPGGPATASAIAALTGRSLTRTLPETPALVAVIDEPACIGCALCLPACPVDAIVGAAHMLHTVISDECTGCELCIEPCPVDCITLVAPA